MEKPFKDDEDSLSETSDLSSVEHLSRLNARKESRPTIVKTVLFGLVVVIAISLSIWSTVTAVRSRAMTSTSLNCGKSILEAKARNCKFDRVLYAWVPEPCFDRELQEHYLAKAETETWFLNWDKTEVVNATAIEAGEVERIYTNAKFTANQCTYWWESLTRSVNQTKPVAELATDLIWHRQCSGFFMAVFDKGLTWKSKMWLETPLQYTSCHHISTDEW